MCACVWCEGRWKGGRRAMNGWALDETTATIGAAANSRLQLFI